MKIKYDLDIIGELVEDKFIPNDFWKEKIKSFEGFKHIVYMKNPVDEYTIAYNSVLERELPNTVFLQLAK